MSITATIAHIKSKLEGLPPVITNPKQQELVQRTIEAYLKQLNALNQQLEASISILEINAELISNVLDPKFAKTQETYAENAEKQKDSIKEVQAECGRVIQVALAQLSRTSFSEDKETQTEAPNSEDKETQTEAPKGKGNFIARIFSSGE